MPEYGRWYPATRIGKGVERVVVEIVSYVHAELLNRYVCWLFVFHPLSNGVMKEVNLSVV